MWIRFRISLSRDAVHSRLIFNQFSESAMSKERDSMGVGNDTAGRDDIAPSASNAGAAGANAGESSGRADFPIIVHCHLRWDFVWQRPQQIFSRLAQNHRILFLEDPVIAEGEPHLAIDEPYPNLVRIVPQIPQALAVNADRDA